MSFYFPWKKQPQHTWSRNKVMRDYFLPPTGALEADGSNVSIVKKGLHAFLFFFFNQYALFQVLWHAGGIETTLK